MPKVQESKSNNNYSQIENSKGKLIKKPHEFFKSNEPYVSTSMPVPNVSTSMLVPPSINVKLPPGNVMGNPQNQYSYPPTQGPFPPRQPYPNPGPSWNNGNTVPNHAQTYPNAARPGVSNTQPTYGNVFCPYRPENMHPPVGNGFRPMHPPVGNGYHPMHPPVGNGFRPMHPSVVNGFRPMPPPVGNGFRPMHPRNDGPMFPLMAAPDISNLSVSQYPNQTQSRLNFSPQVRQEFRPKIESSPSINGPNKGYLPLSSSAPATPTTTTGYTNSSTPVLSPLQPPVVIESGSSSGMWGTQGNPPPSEYVQGLIGVILHALNILKKEKVMPTEPNISDCIQYGDPKHCGTDLKKALDIAIEYHMITVKNVGKLKLYIGKNEEQWKCVNPLDPKQYSKATWERIHKFLTSSSGRVAIMATQCRYEAALVVKKECLRERTLGEILQILNIATTAKKWIIHHQTGWQPITISLGAETTNKIATETEKGIQTVA